MRGTPVLLQLFVIYYGLASVIRLPAFVAALLGLGLNYAAYESEIYRSALEAVPRGQLEAARMLGFTERADAAADPRAAGVPPRAGADDQRLRGAAQGLVARLGAHRGRADQADADLRDQHRQLAACPGLLCAAMYLAMSLPLAHLARRLEARWRMPDAMSAVLTRSRPAADARRPADPAGRRPRRRARRDRRADGAVGLRQDDHPARRSRASSDAARRAGDDRRRAGQERGHGVPVPLPVRAPVGARQRLAGARARAAASPRRRGATRAQQLLEQLGVGHRAEALAARAVGRRSAARGHCPRAGGRSAAAAARRADGVARSRAPQRPRRRPARAGRHRPRAAA